ncbi:Neutrophil cytosol factor [Erysiphe necator]|uniref:Putative nadph oxidase regulator n=1 Tax=Uncinula necator TaxID=52586 RepID=A0A0B1PEM9_UNCNE|nr:Neutrophil cytosol factor [Erysiphe necator]KHJ35765.1 putative nadph oxidase regulator [Erysiphe necator]
MSLKQEIETWVEALTLYDSNKFEEALDTFDSIMDTSKILFNCGVIQATLGEHEKAVELFQRAVGLDQYLAVAYFQQGVSNFLIGDFEESLANFNDTLLYLRGNNMIDYAQLGLNFKLYSCEALFNRGLCYMYLGQKDAGLQDFSYAVKEKVVEDHNVIDDAIEEEAEGYTVFSIPVGVLYRPNQSKVKNLKTKDYLGKARLIAASDRSDAFTGFTGSEIKNAAKLDNKDDRPTENLSYAATNLVKPGLSSKRQNSNTFPPTPPPESERGGSIAAPRGGSTNRAASVKNGAKPVLPRLNTEKDRQDYREEPSPLMIRRARTSASGRIPSSARGSLRERAPPKSSVQGEDYPSELYDMYSNPIRRNSERMSNLSQQRSVSQSYEEDFEIESDYEGDSYDEGDFEMISVRGPRRSQTVSVSGSQRSFSRRIELQKVRVKVHCEEDVRYVMINTDIEFQRFLDRIREKFNLNGRFKLKIRESGEPDSDMITLGDQDDLDTIMMTVRSIARKERAEVGKMEVWVN